MAQPTPYLVSPSTTFVQVDILQNPYTPVILNAVSYPGQTVSVLDATSSFGVLQEPILVSTGYASLFYDGTFSTLINQPQGFVTVQSQLPNIWSFLNSFPFRNQFLSAGALNITTSSMNTAVISTLFESVSSVAVENLLVTGSFLQSTGAVFNTNISSFGPAAFTSTLSVYESVFFSTKFSTTGAAYFYSNVTIQDTLATRSYIQTLSSMYISASIYTLGSISAATIRLQDGLVGTILDVQQSTNVAANIANSILVQSNISTLSSIYVGGNFNTNTLYVNGNAFFKSSISVISGFNVTGTISFSSILSSLNDIAIGGNLGVSGPATFVSTIYANKNITVADILSITKNLSTQNADIQNLNVQSNFLNQVFSTSIYGVSSLSNLGIANARISSLRVGDSIYIGSNLSFLTSASSFIGSTFITQGSISSLQSTFIENYASVRGFSTLKSLYVVNSTFLEGNLNVGGILYTNSLGSASTVVEGDVSAMGSLQVQGVIEISTITLVSSLLAQNFIVSTLQTAYKGITNTSLISTLYTSSLRIGSSQNSIYSGEITVPFTTISTHANYLSAAIMNLSGPINSTYFQVLSSFAINTEPVLNTTIIEGNAYLLSSITIFKNVSTQAAFGNFSGKHFGDASLLVDISYPPSLVLSTIYASTIIQGSAGDKISTNLLYASSGIVYNIFAPQDTINIDGFTIYTNISTAVVPSLSTNYLIPQIYPGFIRPGSQTLLNNIKIIPQITPGAQEENFPPPGSVYINDWMLPQSVIDSNFTFAVGGTMRVSSINISTGFAPPVLSYRADVLYSKAVPKLLTTSPQLYLSSGYLTSFEQNPKPLLVGEQHPLISSVIQPFQSTIILNNTVYINNETKKVGVFTSTPNYTLDVPKPVYVYDTIQTSTLHLSEQIRLHQYPSSFWFAGGTGAIGSISSLHLSQDGETWTGFTGLIGTTSTITSLAYNGNRWVGCFNDVNNPLRFLDTPTNTWTGSPLSNIMRSVAWNGTMYVAVGFGTVPFSNTILTSKNGQNWNSIASGGFGSGLSNEGGFGVAWNGNYWIAVGKGNGNTNSILYSSNGSNWSNVNSAPGFGGGMGVLTGVAWAGKRWIATQGNVAGSNILVSDDTLNWFNGGLDYFNNAANAVAFNGNLVVAVGDAPTVYDQNKTIQYSYDYGQTWNVSQGAGFSTTIGGLCVAWNGSYWIAGGEDGYRKSYDGITWFIPPNNPGYQVNSLGWSSNTTPILSLQQPFPIVFPLTKTISRWVMGGLDFSNNVTMKYSDDAGFTWTNTINSFANYTYNIRVDSNTGMWVAVGDNANSNNIKYSYTNGVSWVNDTISPGLNLNGYGLTQGASLGGGQTLWIAGMQNLAFSGSGNPSTIFYATNSNTSNWSVWTPAEYNPPFSTLFNFVTNSIAYDGVGTYVAVGRNSNGGTGGILFSYDGAVWSDQTLGAFNPGFNVFNYCSGNGVAYGSNVFVAVGYDLVGNTIKYSTDGINWNNSIGVFSGIGFGVAYNGSNLWVAVGSGGLPTDSIKYSGDAIFWSNVNSGGFTSQGTNVSYDPVTGLWAAVGQQVGLPYSTICFSYDGSNWNYPTEPFGFAGGTAIASYTFQSNTFQSNYPSSFLSFYKNPIEGVSYHISTSFISYSASTLSINNSLILNEKQNIFIGGYPSTSLLIANDFKSTLIVSGNAFVSTFTSTVGTTVNSLFMNYAVIL